jgi:PTS system mannose-specific IIA component
MVSEEQQLAIGLVVVTHSDYGSALHRAAEMIMGSVPGVVTIGVDTGSEVDATRTRIRDAIREVDRGHGVLVLTDMFGGTPTNLSLSLLNKENIEVVTGVNMPMLLKAMSELDRPLGELSSRVSQSGEKGIVVAGELLRKKASA